VLSASVSQRVTSGCLRAMVSALTAGRGQVVDVHALAADAELVALEANRVRQLVLGGDRGPRVAAALALRSGISDPPCTASGIGAPSASRIVAMVLSTSTPWSTALPLAEQRRVVDEQRHGDQRLAQAMAVADAAEVPDLLAVVSGDHDHRLLADPALLQRLDRRPRWWSL